MLAVVSDSSPLIYLTRLGQLRLLHQLHGSVMIPQAVWQEVTVGGQGLPESVQVLRAITEGWIAVRSPSTPLTLQDARAAALGRGELEAIALARELGALLVTDDQDGKALAESLGLPVTGTLGVLIKAKRAGHVPQLRPLVEQLRHETTFRMTDALFRQALTEAGETDSGAPHIA